MSIFVHLTQLVLVSASLSNEIFCGSLFLIKIFVISVPTTTAKRMLFLNPRNRKGIRGQHNILVYYVNVCTLDQACVVFCNPFKWDILLFISSQKSYCLCCGWKNSKTNFVPQPHVQESCRRLTQFANTLRIYYYYINRSRQGKLASTPTLTPTFLTSLQYSLKQ